MLSGLRTAVYRTPDLAEGKRWYSRVLGFAPYFDQRTEPTDVGEGIRAADVLDPWGNVFGIIENPHFQLPVAP